MIAAKKERKVLKYAVKKAEKIDTTKLDMLLGTLAKTGFGFSGKVRTEIIDAITNGITPSIIRIDKDDQNQELKDKEGAVTQHAINMWLKKCRNGNWSKYAVRWIPEHKVFALGLINQINPPV